ncbi:MAG TPA: hypothetical protein VIR33_00440, partial [Thermopolyspora sp.]
AAETLLAAHGRVGLMVDNWNHVAVRLYERLGLRRRPVAAARVSDADHEGGSGRTHRPSETARPARTESARRG